MLQLYGLMVNARPMDKTYCKIYLSVNGKREGYRYRDIENILVNVKCKAF